MSSASDLFDPAVFLAFPWGGATTRATMAPCPCGCPRFEAVREKTGAIGVRCVACFGPDKQRGRGQRPQVLGWVDMETGKVTEA